MTISAYYQTWSAPWVGKGALLDLANIPIGIDIVYICFVNPHCKYVKGANKFGDTGLEFSMEFSVVKEAIAILKARKVKVLLSVGGATFKFGFSFNADKAKRLWDLCADLDCDGIDIDWEADSGVHESIAFSDIIGTLQVYRPLYKKYYLTAACFSVGAYDPTSSNHYCGMNIKGLQEAGNCLDWINVMAYDAGGPEMYDVAEAFKAYRKYYRGLIFIGVQVGKQGWGKDLLDLPKLQKALLVSGGNIFIWALGKSIRDPDTNKDTLSVSEILKEALSLSVTIPPVIVPTPPSKVTTSSMVNCPNCKTNISLELTYLPK